MAGVVHGGGHEQRQDPSRAQQRRRPALSGLHFFLPLQLLLLLQLFIAIVVVVVVVVVTIIIIIIPVLVTVRISSAAAAALRGLFIIFWS